MITIVSGLPRSGTSLMMQMLAAGGMPVLSDGERQPDADNPRGYLEWERIKQLPKDPACIAEAEGKVVKVISLLLLSLPEDHEYRVIFMERPLPEVLASQEVMMRHRGTVRPGADTSFMAGSFEKNLRAVNAWLDSKAYVKTLRIPYHEVLRNAETVAQELTQFLGISLDVEAMTRQVDATLYRNRS
ncbi:MAG: sulfotransferase domain-containing protein [Candidatus Sulfotelmatobacter sp.]